MRTKFDWTTELERWLEPFLSRLAHKARRRMCPLYIAGLIGPGERKSIQPMAQWLVPGEYDQLHHFAAAGMWDATPLEAELLVQADRLVGGDNAVLVIDDTALPKKGSHSVGVAAQYASALGKTANCQTLVSATLASGEVPVMVGLRLFLPESWTSDSVRMARTRVPADRQTFRSKPEIAINEVDRMRAAGVRFGCVLADAGYGMSAPFRHALSERGLKWAVGIPRHQKVYPGDVALIFPVAGHGRPRQRHIPDSNRSQQRQCLLAHPGARSAGAAARKVDCRHASAAVRVRVADGPPQRIRDMGGQHMPGDEAWLIGERRSSGEHKYYLSNLPVDTTIKVLASTIKARWICEQAHQQLKEELGLDHFEGRSWHGIHRHALMTMIAYAFLHIPPRKREAEKKNQRAATTAKPTSGTSCHHHSHHRSPPRDVRTVGYGSARHSAEMILPK